MGRSDEGNGQKFLRRAMYYSIAHPRSLAPKMASYAQKRYGLHYVKTLNRNTWRRPMKLIEMAQKNLPKPGFGRCNSVWHPGILGYISPLTLYQEF